MCRLRSETATTVSKRLVTCSTAIASIGESFRYIVVAGDDQNLICSIKWLKDAIRSHSRSRSRQSRGSRAAPQGPKVISHGCNPWKAGRTDIRPLRGRIFLPFLFRRFHLRLMILFPFGELRGL